MPRRPRNSRSTAPSYACRDEPELLDQVKEVSLRFFEKLVIELLVAMGYGGDVPAIHSKLRRLSVL